MKKLLLCPPTFYDIRYEINPWMDQENGIIKDAAIEQYNTLTYAYDQLGIEFDELTPDQNLPDQVFTTDLGQAEKNLFIKASFKYPERAREADIAETYFREKGFEIATLESDVFFEGGDLLKMNDKYFFGYGKRSSKEALPRLSEILKTEIVPIELPDEYFYHLDTCVAPLNEDTVLVNARALSPDGLEVLRHHFHTVIETSEQDNKKLVCNLLVYEQNLIMGEGVSNELKDQLIARGFRIVTLPMTEYLKGGGSIHCVSFQIN